MRLSFFDSPRRSLVAPYWVFPFLVALSSKLVECSSITASRYYKLSFITGTTSRNLPSFSCLGNTLSPASSNGSIQQADAKLRRRHYSVCLPSGKCNTAVGNMQQFYRHCPGAVAEPLRMDEPLAPPNTPGRPSSPPLPVLLPVVEDGKMDVISKLLKDRILLLGNQINDEVANCLVAQFLFLANSDPSKPIKLYINSPGGSVTAGLAIFDTMQYVPCPVETVCFGLAASMGAFLLSAGTKGRRRSLPNARIMIHQPLGGAQGQAADIEIQAKEILFTRQLLNSYMAHFTEQPQEKIEEDSDRDFFMTPNEAKDYGIIDEVIKTKVSHVQIPEMPNLI